MRKGTDGSSDVLVGVLDGGVDDTHPDLAANVDDRSSVDCTQAGVPDQSRDAWTEDRQAHGSLVAGIVAAARNGVGVVGVAPESRIAVVKVFGKDPALIYAEYAICGFMWAAEQGFDVTNSSYYVDPWLFWCGEDEDQAAGREAVTRAVAYSAEKGVANVAIAGNEHIDLANKEDGDVTNECLMLPGELPDVIMVSANDEDGRLAAFSSYGYGKVDVVAPGVSILSTAPGGKYWYMNGTSAAGPHAAGVLALLKAKHPDATPKKLQRLLTEQADSVPCPKGNEDCTGDADYNSFFGHGQVDALEALGRE